MIKQNMIKQLKKVNPLRDNKSWNKLSLKEVKTLYDEGLKLGVFLK